MKNETCFPFAIDIMVINYKLAMVEKCAIIKCSCVGNVNHLDSDQESELFSG